MLQILKSFAPVVLVACLVLAGLEKFTLPLCTSLAIITFGSIGAVHGELRLSAFGTFVIILSEFFEALKLVATQQLLGNLKFSIVEGLYWMSPGKLASHKNPFA